MVAPTYICLAAVGHQAAHAVANKAHLVGLAALLNILLNGLEIVIIYSFAFPVVAVVAPRSAMENVAVILMYSIDLVVLVEQLLTV